MGFTKNYSLFLQCNCYYFFQLSLFSNTSVNGVLILGGQRILLLKIAKIPNMINSEMCIKTTPTFLEVGGKTINENFSMNLKGNLIASAICKIKICKYALKSFIKKNVRALS